MLIRNVYHYRGLNRKQNMGKAVGVVTTPKPIIVVSAGDGAEMTLRELQKTSRDRYKVIGMVEMTLANKADLYMGPVFTELQLGDKP